MPEIFFSLLSYVQVAHCMHSFSSSFFLTKYIWRIISVYRNLLYFFFKRSAYSSPVWLYHCLFNHSPIPFSRGSSQSRNRTRSPVLQADSLPAEPPGKPKNIGVGSLYLLQRVFRTQESNCSLLHWRQILYRLSHQGREIRSIISGGTKDHSLVIFILLGALR